MKTEIEAEEYNKRIWDEFAESEKIFYQEEKRWNNRILKAICNHLGQKFLDDVVQCLNDSEAHGKLELVRSTTGEYQNEEWDSFLGVWVDQWSVGDSGDSWNGYMYIELKKGLWLKTSYSM